MGVEREVLTSTLLGPDPVPVSILQASAFHNTTQSPAHTGLQMAPASSHQSTNIPHTASLPTSGSDNIEESKNSQFAMAFKSLRAINSRVEEHSKWMREAIGDVTTGQGLR
ncbi:hypothetical protein K439DRAFT_1621282 [Ramaria rubella]|nr:hypothetical protein K439DRAFT_1621282 [Ramaria rubella]